MNLNALISAIGSHNWLVLVMLGALYARTLFSNKSRFPWSWAPNWLPLFSGAAGAVITVDAAMQGGSTLGAALPVGFLGLVAGGFFDGLLAAIFGSPANAPAWAKFLVGIIDDVTGGSPGGGSGASKPNSVDPVTAEANKLTPPAKTFGMLPGLAMVALVAIAMLCNGCLSSAPIVAVTPANQAQVTSCENTATWHDGFVVGDFTFTGAAATMGVASVLETSTQSKNVLAIGGAIAGGLAGIATGGTAFTASNFVNDQCSSVVGNLPAAGGQK